MALVDLYKTDFAFTDDFVASPTGDFDVISGLENLRRALLRRLVTRPGSIIHRPNYGVGIQDFQNAPLTLSVKSQLANRIAEQFAQDDRVERVVSISAENINNQPDTILVKTNVKLVAYGDRELQFTPFNEEIV